MINIRITLRCWRDWDWHCRRWSRCWWIGWPGLSKEVPSVRERLRSSHSLRNSTPETVIESLNKPVRCFKSQLKPFVSLNYNWRLFSTKIIFEAFCLLKLQWNNSTAFFLSFCIIKYTIGKWFHLELCNSVIQWWLIIFCSLNCNWLYKNKNKKCFPYSGFR